jgi:hypothetical protein
VPIYGRWELYFGKLLLPTAFGNRFVFSLATFINSIVMALEASRKTGMACVIKKFYLDEFLKQIFIYPGNYKEPNLKKTISGLAEDIDLILLSINSNPVMVRVSV